MALSDVLVLGLRENDLELIRAKRPEAAAQLTVGMPAAKMETHTRVGFRFPGLVLQPNTGHLFDRQIDTDEPCIVLDL